MCAAAISAKLGLREQNRCGPLASIRPLPLRCQPWPSAASIPSSRRASRSRPRTSPGRSARSPSIRPAKQASAVIALLWRAQEQEGWGTEPAIRAVADMLGMAYIRVLEIATFYTMFQLAPVGKTAHLWVCGTTPCMLRGSEALIEICKERIAEHPHELSRDGPLLLGGGRVHRLLRQCACRTDRQGYVRGSRPGAVRAAALRPEIGRADQARLADRAAGVVSRRRPHHAEVHEGKRTSERV